MIKQVAVAADRFQTLDLTGVSPHSLASAYHKLATSFMTTVSTHEARMMSNFALCTDNNLIRKPIHLHSSILCYIHSFSIPH